MLCFYDLKNVVKKTDLSELEGSRLVYSKKFGEKKELDLFLKREYLTLKCLKDYSGLDASIIGLPGVKATTNIKDLFFSRSTDGSKFVIYVSNYSCGVDIKKVSEIDNDVIKYTFTEKENNFLNCIKDLKQKKIYYTLIYTIKESIIKTKNLNRENSLLQINTKLKSEVIVESEKRIFKTNLLVDGLYINSYYINGSIITVSTIKDVYSDLLVN